MSNFMIPDNMQVLLNQALATNLHKLKTKPHRQTTALTNTYKNKKNHHQKKHPKKHLRENKTKILHLLVQGQHLSQQPWK